MAITKNPLRLLNQSFGRIKRTRWSTPALVLSSAALGGIAVALWNRKALAAFHEHDGSTIAELSSVEQEDGFY